MKHNLNDFLIYTNLPAVPEELISSIESIISTKPAETVLTSSKYFETRNVSSYLHDWANDVFKRKLFVKYQIVKPNIPIHKDVGRKVAFNYLIELGGSDAKTCFFDDSKKLLYAEKIPLKTWHQMRTDVYHTVIGIKTTRLAISVSPLNAEWASL